MKAAAEFNHEELLALQPGVIAEMFPQVVRSMSAKRKFEEAFHEQDRERCKGIYRMMHTWHVSSGVPETHLMTMEKYIFIKRLAHFCASL